MKLNEPGINPLSGDFVKGNTGGTAITDATAHTVLTNPTTDRKVVLTGITITNKSASVSTVVQIQDSVSHAVLYEVDAEKEGGGVNKNMFPAVGIPTAKGSSVDVKCITTGAEVYVSLEGFTAEV